MRLVLRTAAAQACPEWPVEPGYLTPHGAETLRRVAASDRARFVSDRVIPQMGFRPIRIVADSDQRTIATAEVWAAAVMPGCKAEITHRPEDVADPIFSPINERTVAFDVDTARAAVLACAGRASVSGKERRLRPVLSRLDAILYGAHRAPAGAACGIGGGPSGLAPPSPTPGPSSPVRSTAPRPSRRSFCSNMPMAGRCATSAGDVRRLPMP